MGRLRPAPRRSGRARAADILVQQRGEVSGAVNRVDASTSTRPQDMELNCRDIRRRGHPAAVGKPGAMFPLRRLFRETGLSGMPEPLRRKDWDLGHGFERRRCDRYRLAFSRLPGASSLDHCSRLQARQASFASTTGRNGHRICLMVTGPRQPALLAAPGFLSKPGAGPPWLKTNGVQPAAFSRLRSVGIYH